jgi:peroxiredoxin
LDCGILGTVPDPCQQEKRRDAPERSAAPISQPSLVRDGRKVARRANRRWRAALSLLAFAVFLSAATESGAASAADLDPLLRGLSVRPWWGDAPPVGFHRLDGTPQALTEARGRAVLLYFWATWCPVCTGELPSQIEALQRDFGDRGLAIWAVSMRESPERVSAWLDAHPVSIPLFVDPDGAASDAFRATGTPTFVLIDRSGQLVGRGVGPRDWSGPGARALLRALTGSP